MLVNMNPICITNNPSAFVRIENAIQQMLDSRNAINPKDDTSELVASRAAPRRPVNDPDHSIIANFI